MNTAATVFFRADSVGNPSTPADNAGARSGSVDVTTYSAGGGTHGTFEGRFGVQTDPVDFRFNARSCSISADAVRAASSAERLGWLKNGKDVKFLLNQYQNHGQIIDKVKAACPCPNIRMGENPMGILRWKWPERTA